MLTEWHPARSRLARRALLGSVVAALASLFFTAPKSALQWLVLALLLGVFLRALIRDWRRETLEFGCEQGQWFLRREGLRESVVLRHSHFLTHRVGVIGFTTAAGDTVTITILPDSLSVDDCRSLAVALA